MSRNPSPFQSIAVYCGAAPGRRPAYTEAAEGLGRFLGERGIRLVFGGGRVGLMGAVADGALAAGGEVVGVIPEKLRDLEVAHGGLTRLEVVDGMHPRKLRMTELADAFVALPGGFGTLDELFEVVTWNQLEYHHKPVGLLDVEGFFQPLCAYLDHAAAEGFIRPQHRAMIVSDPDPARLLTKMATIEIPSLRKWIEREYGAPTDTR